MGSSRLGFNVNAQRLGDKAYFMDVMRSLKPRSTTVMHGQELAREVAEVTGGKAFFRTDVDKDEALLRMKPEEYVSYYIKAGIGEGVHGYILNEPVQSDQFSWAHIVNWLTEVGKRLHEKGYAALIGNIGPGTFEQSHVDSGVFDPLLRMIAETGHTLGVHEYTGILLPFGVGRWPREWLLDKSKVQIGNWPVNLPLQEDGRKYPNYWHLLRHFWLLIRAREIGLDIKNIPIVVSEFGWDRMPDLTMSGQLNPYEALQGRYGLVAPHKTYRGVNSLRKVFEDYYPQWGFERAVWEQLRWALGAYPSTTDLHLFTWSEGAQDWDYDYGCNYSRLKVLHTLMIAHANADTPAPQPEPTYPDSAWLDYCAKVTGVPARVRKTPSVNADVVGKLVQGETPIKHVPFDTLSESDQERATENPYKWQLVKLADGVVGWVRSDAATLTAIVDTPPVVDPVREVRLRHRIELVELQAIANGFRDLAQELSNAIEMKIMEIDKELEAKEAA